MLIWLGKQYLDQKDRQELDAKVALTDDFDALMRESKNES